MFGMWNTASPERGLSAEGQLLGAAVFIGDDHPPRFTQVSHNTPAGWVRDANINLTATAQDGGLGMKEVWVDSGGWAGPSTGRDPCEGRARRTPCPATKSLSTTFNTAALPEGDRVPITVHAADVLGYENPSTNQASQTWHAKIDHTGPIVGLSGTLWEKRTRLDDHRNEGLYSAAAGLAVEANDRGTSEDRRSGVKHIRIAVQRPDNPEYDAPVVDAENPACTSEGCPNRMEHPWTFEAENYVQESGDGDYQIRVVATDAAGNSAVAEWTVTVDRRGDIYHAKSFDADPEDTGRLESEEWARIGTELSRHEDADTLATRSTVPCKPSEPSGAQCDEVRLRSRFSELNPDSPDGYEINRGAPSDPSLDTIAEILAPAHATGPPEETGPIASAAAEWQRLPPAHGDTFGRYQFVRSDSDGETATITVWADTTTKMPIRATAALSDESTDTVHWSYTTGRLERQELPDTFFSVAKPANTGKETEVFYGGGGTIGPQTDAQTQATFFPRSLGAQPEVAGSVYCLGSKDVVHFRSSLQPSSAQSDPTALSTEAYAPETRVDALYTAILPQQTCQPGRGEPQTPAIEVMSFAPPSLAAQEWQATYERRGRAIQLNPLDADFLRGGLMPVTFGTQVVLAYVLGLTDGRTSALISLSDAVVIVQGPFAKEDLQTVVNQLELA